MPENTYRVEEKRGFSLEIGRDPLTGLLNRQGMQVYLDEALGSGRGFALVLLDIDRFKLINDRLGYTLGDEVLRRFAALLRGALKPGERIARWGSEEFLCLLPGADADEALAFAERLRRHLQGQTITADGHALQLTASFGIAAYPQDGEDLNALLSAADAALYRAKQGGRNRIARAADLPYRIFHMANLIERALDEGRIRAAFQPIVELSTGEAVAEEALARIVLPEGEVLEAQTFIEAACLLQLEHRIDHAIMLQTLERCVSCVREGKVFDHFINISADLLRHEDLVQGLLEAAQAHCRSCNGAVGDVKPLIIEFTEREWVDDMDQAVKLLQPFVDFGIRLALDDFGAGYASFLYLLDLPVSFLKLSGDLVMRIHDPRVHAIIEGIQRTAERLGLVTLAEHVETEAQAEALRRIGICLGQGYLFGRPTLP